MPQYSANALHDDWKNQAAGAYAVQRCRGLLRMLLAGWPRRSRSMLVLNAGSGMFLETLWESGFDVTGQVSDQHCLTLAKQRLGSRAGLVLSPPDHLPFDDGFFDYAVAVFSLEFWDKPQAVLEEIGRLVCSGLIVIFPSSWSLFGLECRLREEHSLCGALRPLLQSPRRVARLLRRAYGGKKTVWSSILPGPSHSWIDRPCFKALNKYCLPLPVGAFAGVRVDFGPLYAGVSPLLLRSSAGVISLDGMPENAASIKSAVNDAWSAAHTPGQHRKLDKKKDQD